LLLLLLLLLLLVLLVLVHVAVRRAQIGLTRVHTPLMALRLPL
jgi:hypothetical protein